MAVIAAPFGCAQHRRRSCGRIDLGQKERGLWPGATRPEEAPVARCAIIRSVSLPHQADAHLTCVNSRQGDCPRMRTKQKRSNAMKAADIMTSRVISVAPDASILECIRLMLQYRISGLPVIDAAGSLVGVVTEGDFLRRVEAGTARKRPRWLEFIAGPGRLADEYVHSHGRKVAEVMSPEPIAISEDTPLEEVVRVMEQRRIKRLPVMRGSKVVGIVSRANLLHALASVAREAAPAAKDDQVIRERVLAEIAKQPW
ncbi:MAG TPA: CBS domain-containing protein, partial [Xanthobacteraceae bacterium]|nr:CBS domain-containing protein [Xanthobacteraceae bacterium]